MKTGKQEHKGICFMPKTRTASGITLLVSLLLVFSIVVGSTVAYLVTMDDPVVNIFQPTQIKYELHHNAQNNYYYVESQSDIHFYARAAVVVTWKNATGAVYAEAPTGYTVENQVLDEVEGKWVKHTDGYWYFAEPISPGLNAQSQRYTTSALGVITSAVQRPTGLPDGYSLSVEVLVDCIQADGVTATGTPAVTEAWGISIDFNDTKKPLIVGTQGGGE